METKTLRLTLTWILALIASLFFRAPLFYFVPPLILSLYLLPFSTSLYLAFGVGLWIDLLSGGFRLGVNAFFYPAVLFCLFPLKKYLFIERASTFPLLTFFFSFLFTLLYFVLIEPFSLNLSWISTEFFLMPLADAFYAYLLISLPALLFFNSARKRLYRLRRRINR